MIQILNSFLICAEIQIWNHKSFLQQFIGSTAPRETGAGCCLDQVYPVPQDGQTHLEGESAVGLNPNKSLHDPNKLSTQQKSAY